jgi:hypothetical protein
MTHSQFVPFFHIQTVAEQNIFLRLLTLLWMLPSNGEAVTEPVADTAT